MKRLGVLALAALLLFTAACGRSGERRALELAGSWDEQRLGRCRYEAACAGELFVLSVRPERVGGEGPSACAWGGEALARRLYRELRACLGEGHDILIALYTAGGILGESYLNGAAQSRAAV